MVDKNSAPSYSIAGGKKDSFIKINGQPGPGAYETAPNFKSSSSQDKLGKQKRFINYQTVAPGPGTYSNKKQEHIPTALVLPKSKQQKISNLPGPGAYEPDYHKIVKSNSSYKIGSSQKVTDYSKATKHIPGPGQYETAKSTLVGLNQGIKFGPQRKIQLGHDPKTPGPGQYNNQNLYYNAEMTSNSNIIFSKSNRSQSYSTLVPGPGSYLLKSQLQASLNKSKGYKIGERVHTKQKTQKLPGPGAYQSTSPHLTKKGTPSFSMGKDTKMKIQNLKQLLSKPGPLNYDTKVSAFQNRSFVIGKDKRKGLGTQSVVPGPGAYEHKTLLNNHTYSLPRSQRKSLADQKKTPGPFEYNPKLIYNSQFENIKVGTDHRRTFEIKDHYPGPGEYKYEDEHKKQNGFKIGKQKRGFITDSKIPGPGMYNIPSTISNLPQYAAPSSHK